MTISRWGKRVEEAMAREVTPEPVEEKSLQERITAEADRLEISMTCEQICTWMIQKFGRNFQGCTVEVSYDFPLDRYEIVVLFEARNKEVVGNRYNAELKTHRTRAVLRSEDVIEHSRSVDTWTKWLTGIYSSMRRELSSSLIRAGWDTISHYTGNQGKEIVTSPRSDKREGVMMTYKTPAILDPQEEAAAIASIQRTLEDNS